ncbi:cupredoxin domain-containing protein [Sulfitobacter sabulilitoris]|nr:cupredoxin family copper-binding protein [Sulfitobacter sabulilitoris]
MLMITRRSAVLAPLAAVFVPTPARSALRHEVVIRNMAFQPASLSIRPGDSVTWVNRGLSRHTVTGTQGRWNTGVLPPGSAATVTFTELGTHAYFCSIHPSMKGRIIVN